MMMESLVKEAGMFRSGNVGVYAGAQLIHAGRPAKYVPDLIRQLFLWLKKSKHYPLIKSCIFHYKFDINLSLFIPLPMEMAEWQECGSH